MSEPARQITKGFDDQGDICLGFFREMYTAGHFEFPRERQGAGSRVRGNRLAHADEKARPDLHLTGVDQRKHPPRPGANELVLGDIMQPGLFPPRRSTRLSRSV
jgi:hypothetical protein